MNLGLVVVPVGEENSDRDRNQGQDASGTYWNWLPTSSYYYYFLLKDRGAFQFELQTYLAIAL